MTVSPAPHVVEDLRSLLEKGRRRAEHRGPALLVSTTVPIPSVDPLRIFDRGAPAERAFWHQPIEALSMTAVGTAARLPARGSRRFAQVTEEWRRIMSWVVLGGSDSSPLPQPVCLGGFAFDPARPTDDRWRGYGDALIVIPKFLLTSRHGSSWLTVNAMVTSECDPARVADATGGVLARLLSSNDDRVPDETGDLVLDPDSHAARWKRTVTAVVDDIRRGTLEKLVLALQVRARCRDRLPLSSALHRLRSVYRNCTTFAFATRESCFLGATPERLVRLEGRLVRATCLAGSTPRGATETEDARRGDALLADPKEQHEHRLVVDALKEALRPTCSELRMPSTPTLLRMPNIQHICTPVEAVTHGTVHVLDLVERLHPTPAAAGLPRETALRLIRTYEPFDRGWYGAPVGWVGRDGSGEFVVAIRSALVRGTEVSLYAGCGIVTGSDPDREYEEACLKLRSMRWALGNE